MEGNRIFGGVNGAGTHVFGGVEGIDSGAGKHVFGGVEGMDSGLSVSLREILNQFFASTFSGIFKAFSYDSILK